MTSETMASRQFHDAFDHLASVFFQQALAMSFGDDRADVLFESLFVRCFAGPAGQSMQCNVEAACREHQRQLAGSSTPTRSATWHRETARPKVEQWSRATRLRLPTEASRSPARWRLRSNHGGMLSPCHWSHAQNVPAPTNVGHGNGPQRVDSQPDLIAPAQDLADPVRRIPPAAEFFQLMGRELGQRSYPDRGQRSHGQCANRDPKQ